MRKLFYFYFMFGLILLAVLSFNGCGSSSGGTVEPPPPPPVEVQVAQTYDENCSLCHATGSIADVAEYHSLESNSPLLTITDMREVDLGGGDLRIEVDFTIVDNAYSFLPPVTIESASDARFTLTKLDTSGGGSGNWQSYIINSSGTAATYERGNAGTLTDNGNGSYTYQFSFNMNTVTDPVTSDPITYDRSMTHRVAIQYSDNVDNAWYDFVPDGSAATSREIVVNDTCNKCHIKLGFHGGDRININYCVQCHNPGSLDPDTGNTVDFKVMIHKIHAGEELEEPFVIIGHGGSEHNYGEVVFPAGIQNCIKCHTGGDDSDNYKNYPSEAACSSCHDYPGVKTAMEIEDAHEDEAVAAADTIEFNILEATATAGSTGDYDLTVDFSFTDPTNGDAPYDISDTSTVDLSSLSFLIGWDTSDYYNEGASTPAQPVSAGVSDATDTGGNIYTLTVTGAIPAEVTGSGVIALQGRPSMDLDGDGEVDDRVPAKSVVRSFAITDSSPMDRRSVVDINKCDNCHGYLSLHGSNRNDEIQVCVICHNADATDFNVRPTDGSAVDGKEEESIDFKYMIHSIHAGSAEEHGVRENGIVIYGYRGSINDFSHVALPTGDDNLMNCEGCHMSGTFELPISSNVLPTTIKTGDDVTTPDDDTNITPIAAVCSSCHDGIESKSHMADEGGLFDFKPFRTEIQGGGSSGSGDDEASVCGPGGTQPEGHTDRTDCCSCHSG